MMIPPPYRTSIPRMDDLLGRGSQLEDIMSAWISGTTPGFHGHHKLGEGGPQLHEVCPVPRSAFRVPRSAFRVPRSAFRVPRSMLLASVQVHHKNFETVGFWIRAFAQYSVPKEKSLLCFGNVLLTGCPSASDDGRLNVDAVWPLGTRQREERAVFATLRHQTYKRGELLSDVGDGDDSDGSTPAAAAHPSRA